MYPKNVISAFALGENFDYVLFQTAIFFAENGLNVWVISPATFEKIPGDIKPPDKEILQLITFMYLKDHKDFITHLNGIHLWHKLPNIIIVNKFEKYCDFNADVYKPLQAALVSTSLLDSTAACAVKRNEKMFLLVACSESVNCSSRLQTIADLYFPNVVYKTEDNSFLEHIKTFFK